MFGSAGEIIAALRAYGDVYDPKSTSVLEIGRSRSADQEPFRYGFVSTFDVRTELVCLLRALDDRSRTLLVLWYHQGRPVTRIARFLNISRIHCYRLRDQALDKMLALSEEQAKNRKRHA